MDSTLAWWAGGPGSIPAISKKQCVPYSYGFSPSRYKVAGKKWTLTRDLTSPCCIYNNNITSYAFYGRTWCKCEQWKKQYIIVKWNSLVQHVLQFWCHRRPASSSTTRWTTSPFRTRTTRTASKLQPSTWWLSGLGVGASKGFWRNEHNDLIYERSPKRHSLFIYIQRSRQHLKIGIWCVQLSNSKTEFKTQFWKLL